MSDVGEWLDALGLGEHADAFERNAIALDLLGDLDDDDLQALGVGALGHRKRILKAISELERTSDVTGAAPVSVRKLPARDAERRQLTVMFCDLVGSTKLSQRLDPEELRDLIGEFQDVCTSTVESHRGYVARYMGDGILVYFGYPSASEDDAALAVQAGAALIERLAAPVRGESLKVRIGVATGPVVVGDLIGEGAAQESAVVGATPNLAARLQARAEPGSLLVSDLTKTLTQGFFRYEDVGLTELKGFDAPIHVWRMTGARALRSRFEALRDARLSEFVGRRSELGLLVERWEAAVQGEGQVVLIGGEAGVGKSRLTEELIGRVSRGACRVLRYQCAPNRTNSAFYPFIRQLWQAAGLSRDDSSERKLDKLEAYVNAVAPLEDRATALCASLLSLPMTRYDGFRPPPGREKAEMMGLLERLLESLSRVQSLLVVFEDVHWADPTTQEVIASLIGAAAALTILVVVTHRSEFQPPWRSHGHVTELRLNNLRQVDCKTMINRLCGRRALPEDVCSEILVRTDGVPLFVEELTKTVLSSGTLVAQGDRFVRVNPSSDIIIPSTLSDSLMARLDRLSGSREVAQIGACVGREFSRSVVLAVSADRPEDVDDALRELESEQLIYRRGEPPHVRYVFKHALIRDAAAASLLKRVRRRTHRKIAAFLEAAPDVRDQHPELLAHHFAEAGVADEASSYWLAAARKASRHGAHQEALGHVSAGLQMLKRLPAGSERDRRELDLQIVRGSVSMQSSGFGAAQGEQAYTRARALIDSLALDDPERRFTVMSGLRRSYTHHGQFEAAAAASRECLRIAEQTGEPYMLRDAHYSMGIIHCHGGDFVASVAQFERGVRHEHLEPASAESTSGSPPASEPSAERHVQTIHGVASNHSNGAVSLWACGYPDRARRWCARVLDFERTLELPYWKAYYLTVAGFLTQRLRDYESLRDQSARGNAIARENRLKLLEGWSRAMLGWVDVMTGEPGPGLAALEEGVAITEESGSLSGQAWLETLHAEAYLQCDRASDGLAAIERAELSMERTGIREWEVETRRIKALLLALAEPEEVEGPEQCLRDALAVAARQGAKSLELRCTVSLGRLLSRTGRQAEARARLATICDWFEEGFDTPDFKEAQALLAELS